MPTDDNASPLVSVITRTKNRPLLLKRAMESVLNQTYTAWEHIIVNDGGQIEEVKRLEESQAQRYRGRSRILSHSESLGMEVASNNGIRESSGKFIVIHDDDDSWDPDFLMECIKFLDNHNPSLLHNQQYCGVVTQSTRVLEQIVDNNVITVSRDPFNDWVKSISLFRLLSSNVFPPISFLFKRSLVEEIGYFREDMPVLGDWDFHIRACLKYEIGVIQAPLANYHHRLSSPSSVYSNTVVDADCKHRQYENLYRNQLLREDLSNGRIGIGIIMALSHHLEIIASAMHKFAIFKELIFNNRFSRLAKKALKIGSNKQP